MAEYHLLLQGSIFIQIWQSVYVAQKIQNHDKRLGVTGVLHLVASYRT